MDANDVLETGLAKDIQTDLETSNEIANSQVSLDGNTPSASTMAVEPFEAKPVTSGQVISDENTPSASTLELEPFVAQDVPSTSAESGVCGLYNLGNTCYMNSALQCLLHEESLQEHFLSSESRFKDGSLLQELTVIYSKYWSGKWSSIVPRKFKKQLELIHSQFVGSGQHDGQELLALALASLHQELKKLHDDAGSEDSSVVADEKNIKRKRTSSHIDDSMPNNKRIDFSTLNKEYLTITSLIGKEKKTANVNVLNTDVECDEEITTDHSNKFSQLASRRISDDSIVDRELNNMVEQRRKSVDRTSFVDQIKDLRLRQLKGPSSKQTNVIADIKRHEKECFDPASNDCDSSVKKMESCTLEVDLDLQKLCGNSKVDTDFGVATTVTDKKLGDCSHGDGFCKAVSSTTNEQQDTTDEKMIDCCFDELDESVARATSPELIDTAEELQDTASNIRGDICSASSLQSNNYLAEEMWQKYIEQNRTVVVDTLQGQMESTVVCCKCSHKSTTYEPFMYLSVPIPHALQRIFSVRIIPLHGSPTTLSIFAMKEGRVEDLMESISDEIKQSNLSIDFSIYSLCEVKNFRILKVLENNNSLKSINFSSRTLEAVEFLSKVSDHDDKQAVQSAWNSCCICLEELSDSELLKHQLDSCSILMCHACLQNSTEHYGLDNFSCPMCHMRCDPAADFVPLASANQNRDVVISVNFLFVNDHTVNFLAASRLLRTATSLSAQLLHTYVQELVPDSLKPLDYNLVFCSLDGASCSRCDVTSTCTGCYVVAMGDGDVTLHPGDNIGVRFSQVPDSKQEMMQAVEEVTSTPETPVTLDMCLNAFTKNEILDSGNPWYCPTCQSYQIAEKRLRICRWPSTLIVYIKRFLYRSKTAVKVDDPVLFPVEDFEPGRSSETEMSFTKSYDLNSCVSHYGGVYSGHYTSCCKHPVNGKWHLFNDETVSPHDPSSKDASSVYILFYKEKNSPKRISR